MDLTRTLSCLGFVLVLVLAFDLSSAEYPGVIELVGFSNRRARTHYIPTIYNNGAESARHSSDDDESTPEPSAAKLQADINTVKQNFDKYKRLLTLDRKNLPEPQKDMLERIVERVARLKETYDIEELQQARKNSTNTNNSGSNQTTITTTTTSTTPKDSPTSYTHTTAPSTVMDTETDPTLVLDETTLLHLQSSMDELAAAQAAVTAQTTRMHEVPTTTEIILETEADSRNDENGATSLEYGSTTIDPQTDATDPDEQFVVARANNNNIAAITAIDSDTNDNDGSSTLSTVSAASAASQQRTLTTSSKLAKTRATKRPGAGSTKTNSATGNSKRGQRPSTAGLYTKQTTTKQKSPTATITTTQPLQYTKQKTQQQHKQQQQQYYQHKVSLADKIAAVTPATLGLEQRTSPSTVAIGAAAYGASSTSSSSTNGYNDMVYDEHVNTSAIIDSLNNAREEFYQQKPLAVSNKDKKPSSATAKPTKYHYYPHNQHIYLLPECAIQQVCNAVYVRLNYTQPLCACPSRYRDPCSASLNEDDQHTTKLVGDGKKKAITLAKTCEATTEMRECRSPKDWSLLALQNTRTGKSHYLVICRCPDHFKMEGPMAHDQPTYASVPGIRVFGMMCVKPGYSVRKPSAQPPKRYQLQKPFYRPNTQSSFINNNQYGGSSSATNNNNNGNIQTSFNKDNYGRPIYGSSGSSTSAFSSNINSNTNTNNNNNNYHSSQDNLQQHQQQQQQQQHQPTYQYLNRPESIHSSSSNVYRPDTLTSINNFPGSGNIYGRNNERQGEAPIEAQPVAAAVVAAAAAPSTGSTEDDGKILISTSTQPTEEARTTLSADLLGNKSGEQLSLNQNANPGLELSVSESAAAAGVLPETHSEESKQREKRSMANEHIIEAIDNEDMPEFPWDRVIEFQKTIHWD